MVLIQTASCCSLDLFLLATLGLQGKGIGERNLQSGSIKLVTEQKNNEKK